MTTLFMMALIGLAIAYIAFPQFKARVDVVVGPVVGFVKTQIARLRKK